MSLTPLINIHSRIYPRIFEKIQNGPNGILRGPRDTDLWKETWRRKSRVREGYETRLFLALISDICVERLYRRIWRRFNCFFGGKKIVFTCLYRFIVKIFRVLNWLSCFMRFSTGKLHVCNVVALRYISKILIRLFQHNNFLQIASSLHWPAELTENIHIWDCLRTIKLRREKKWKKWKVISISRGNLSKQRVRGSSDAYTYQRYEFAVGPFFTMIQIHFLSIAAHHCSRPRAHS